MIKIRLSILNIFVFMFGISETGPAFASFLTGYQLGVDYSNSIDKVDLKYDTDRTATIPESCNANPDRTGKMTCGVEMNGGSANGFGLFLERAFKRQGDYYFDYDVAFGVRYLKGEMAQKDSAKFGLPLKQASFQMGAAVAKPYVKLGYTPSSKFPDLFISVGPSAQVAIGKVSINDQKESVVTGTSSGRTVGGFLSGFVELEIVPFRFGTGYLSVFSSHDFSSGEDGTKIYPKGIDGMDEFKGHFTHAVGGMIFGFGVKLLLAWP